MPRPHKAPRKPVKYPARLRAVLSSIPGREAARLLDEQTRRRDKDRSCAMREATRTVAPAEIRETVDAIRAGLCADVERRNRDLDVRHHQIRAEDVRAEGDVP